MMAYYKTSDPCVLQAWKSYLAQAAAIDAAGHEFAKGYPGAKALFSTCFHSGRQFFGLKFNPAMPQPLWTKPDHKAGMSQFPRASLPSGIKGDERKKLAAELKTLNETFRANRPEGKADLEEFLESMGLSSGALFFSSFKQIVVGDVIYISTTATVSDVMTEIFGSEFEAAESAKAA
ncbi:MAG: hypothetical protein JWP42_4332 [Pseudomonas sp.]|nr:hypothetical protein [Pseudomonas sp.]